MQIPLGSVPIELDMGECIDEGTLLLTKTGFRLQPDFDEIASKLIASLSEK